MNKKDCKYGRFEARLKVTKGQGFLPAFWMMPTQEDLYGQWPKCGEIDIMEVLGSETNKAYATIHYGEPHTEQQGYKKSTGLDYSESFHIYACEWEPGEIRFYIDNTLVKTIDDWFTRKNGFDEVAYPAPFDQGSNRMDYWTIEKNRANADITVTNNNNVRELKVTVPETVANVKDVIISQDKLALQGNHSYVLNFKARGEGTKQLKVDVAGKETVVELSRQMKTYTYHFKTDEVEDKASLQFIMGVAGTTYIDDVSIVEEGMLINSDFSNGLTGYELFVDGSAQAVASVDSLTEKNAACIKINDTGAQDWCIQLKQNNVTLKEGKTYKLSFEAKCDKDREMMYAIQKDGSSDNDWTPYSGSHHIDLTDSYQTFSKTFTMDYATDKKAILSLSMGNINDAAAFKIEITNIVIEKTGDAVMALNEELLDDISLEENEVEVTETDVVGTETEEVADKQQEAIAVVDADEDKVSESETVEKNESKEDASDADVLEKSESSSETAEEEPIEEV